MRVLLTGATGFIGRYLVAALLEAGNEVVPAVRRPAEADRLLRRPAAVGIDFNRAIRPENWLPHLAGIDAVINCAGILQGSPGQSIAAIHAAAPIALFRACMFAGVRRVIQISAISADPAAGTEYAQTKHEADVFLAGADLDWVILRPSLIHAQGAYGGTALFRGLAALPWAIPVPGSGKQQFQPIHMDDLTEAIVRILADPGINRVTIDPVGPEPIALRGLLTDLRHWLGFPPARVVSIPMTLIGIAARAGDLLGGPVNTTALRQLEYGNVGSVEPLVQALGFRPAAWRDALLAHPAQTQDRWHARLYFVRPLLRASLAILWLASGIVGLRQPTGTISAILGRLGLTAVAATVAFWATCLGDIAIGLAILTRWRPRVIALVQVAIVLAYTLGLTFTQPGLWADPFGPLLKNLPILAAILALAAIESDR